MGKAKAVAVEGTTIVAETAMVVVFKVNRVLTESEYAELEKRVRAENKASGVKVVLAPFSVDVAITEVPVAATAAPVEAESVGVTDASAAEEK